MEYMQEVNFSPTTNIDLDLLHTAMDECTVLCAKALVYERGIGLRFNLGGYEAIMPTSEVGISLDGTGVKEAAVVTRINKNVCFIVDRIDESNPNPVFYLSRKKAQEIAYAGYIRHMRPGDIIPCNVTDRKSVV